MRILLMNETGVLECEDSDLQALVDRGYVAEVGDDVYEVTELGEAYWQLVLAGRPT